MHGAREDPRSGRRRRQRTAANSGTRAVAATKAGAAMSGGPRRSAWRLKRWAITPAVALLALALRSEQAIASQAAVGYDEGVTYCWEVDGSVFANTLSPTTPMVIGSGKDCPFELKIELSETTFHINEAVEIAWTAVMRNDRSGGFLAANKFDIDDVYLVQDRLSQQMCHVVRSEVGACAPTVDCNPVMNGAEPISTISNRIGNFSNGQASFSSNRLVLTETGDITLVAHMVLPGAKPKRARYDYAVYRTVHVKPAAIDTPVITNDNPDSNKSQGLSNKGNQDAALSTQSVGIMVICGVVAAAMVGIGFVTLRKIKSDDPILEPKPNAGNGADGRSRTDGESSAADELNQFAMLSNEEMLMRSLPPPAGASPFLSAHAPMQSTKKRSKPESPQTRYVQATSIDATDAVDADESNESAPSTARHDGVYLNMGATSTTAPSRPEQVPAASKIFYNDISEDEIVDQAPNTDTTSATAAARAARTPLTLANGQSARRSTKLTFEDLRHSTARGPKLTLSDLEESQRYQQSIREDSSGAVYI